MKRTSDKQPLGTKNKEKIETNTAPGNKKPKVVTNTAPENKQQTEEVAKTQPQGTTEKCEKHSPRKQTTNRRQ